MAPRKAGDRKSTIKNSGDARGIQTIPQVQADNQSIAIDGINVGGDVGGSITIGHTIGYTAEQVSVLLKQITTTLQPKKFDGRCPYKGLEVFEEEDAELFFGRERLVNELVGRVKESRTVFITGPSGSGKSSLVRAGLIHALKQGAIKGSERWLYETMKPGREPVKDLALAFSRLKSPELQDYFLTHSTETDILNKCAESVLSSRKDQRFVLFIDQFEEVFTQINVEEERIAFINMLAHAGTVENGRVIVLFSMRSDFVSNCATYPALNELLSQEFRQIGAMQPDELVSAIALPARHVGLPIEDELIACIINDMKGEPDALPLMQFALKDLFDSKQAEGGVIALTLADYLKHGGIHKSLERHADATFAKLSPSEQELTRSIFSGLIEIGRGTQDTKRTALFDELIPANTKPEDVLAIVQKLADARLIITDEQAGKDTVTISHEKLIEAWPWLKKLVNENRDAIALQNEIASDAKEWEDHNRDVSYLYSGVRLANVREQLGGKKLVLSETAHEFVIAAQAQQQRNQRTRILGVAIPIGLVIGAVILFSYISSANSASLAEERLIAVNTQAALVSTSQAIAVTAQAAAEEAQKQANIARAGELAAQSIEIREKNFQISLLLGIESFRSYDSARSRGALLDVTTAHPQLLYYLIGYAGFLDRITFSPNGHILASGNYDGKIILWDVETRQPIGQPLKGHTAPIWSIAFSPDGKILASGSGDETIILWDVETRQPIGQPLKRHTANVYSVTFSPDGKTLASGSDDETIILWDFTTRQPIGQPLIGHTGAVLSTTFSPNSKTLASGSFDHTIILWDVETRQPIGQPLIGHTDNVSSVTFSPDGKTLASGSDDGKLILWDVETHQPIGRPLTEHKFSILSIAFSPDGKTLASGSIDETIILWNVTTQQPIGQPLTGLTTNAFTGYVDSIAFSPDGKTLASGRSDGTLILWDIVTARQPIGRPITGFTDSVSSAAFSPDGQTLASGSDDGTIILWDVETRQPIGQPLKGHTAAIWSIAFSPDGKTLASGSDDNTIILWDVETRQPIGEPLTGHRGPVLTVAFSPDGKTLASGSFDNTIILWNVESRRPIGQPLTGHTGPVRRVAFSPDDKILASISDDGKLILWDVKTHQSTGSTGQTSSVAFSPDRKTVASGSDRNTIILWDVETRQLIGQPLIGQTVLLSIGHSGSVWSVTFSPDGKTLASVSDDGAIILWDVETRQPIGQPLIGHTDSLLSIAFLDDQTLASVSIDGTIILWNINPQYWIRQSCQRAGRNFTRNEWDLYFPNEEYRKTCEQWPLEQEAIVTPTATP